MREDGAVTSSGRTDRSARRRYVRFTRWRRRRFFRALEETGHAQMAGRGGGGFACLHLPAEAGRGGVAEKMREAAGGGIQHASHVFGTRERVCFAPNSGRSDAGHRLFRRSGGSAQPFQFLFERRCG
jgi:hypothetical protein